MRFSTLFSTAALVTGIAADVATVKSVFGKIGTLTDTLTSDVGSYSGSIDQIQSDSNAILAAIKSGTSTISGSGDLSQTEALQLQPVVKQLQGKISDAVDALISKKSDLVSDGFGEKVEQALVAQNAGAQQLADATTSLVPKALQGIAAQLASGITKELQSGIDAFKGTGGGSSSTSESSSASATSTMESTMSPSMSGTMVTTTPPTYSTGSSMSMPTGTGGYTPTGPATTSPIPTNAAALNAVSGAVGVAAVFAAMVGL